MESTLWHAIAALVSIACLFWLSLDLRRQPLPRVLVFVVYALFFRFLLSAFHPFTFPPIIGSFSINALYSLAVIAGGFIVISHRLLLLRYLLPVYALITLILVSALYNGTLGRSIQSLLKWLFFIVIALAIYESCIRVERTLVIEKLIKSFCIPVVLQIVSVALGHFKLTEIDGSVSYLGGYNHEAVFSVMLVTVLILAALRQLIQPPTKRAWRYLPLLLAIGVLLANYRTNILAVLLPLAGYLWFRLAYARQPLGRIVTLLAIATGLALMTLLDTSAIVTRFSEIATVLDKPSSLFKSPRYFTDWEQDYFSSRIYIWSQYIEGYLRGDVIQHLIGLGPDTWNLQFRKYAHNTFIGTLYELGLLGTAVLACLFLANLRRALTGPLTTYNVLLFLGLLGFLVMNLGTMPLWQIEGMILFAVLNALTWERKLACQQSLHAHAPSAHSQETGNTRLNSAHSPLAI
jgi:hypothetical protein